MEDQQELMMQLQMLEQQMQNIHQQLQSVEQAIVEISSLHLGLDELTNGKDKEVLALIGKGIYAKAKLVSEDLIVDIGEKSFVKKTIPKTKQIVATQVEKLEEAKVYLNNSLQDLSEQVTTTIEKAQKETK
jgi:prefoldin alpha subunit